MEKEGKMMSPVKKAIRGGKDVRLPYLKAVSSVYDALHSLRKLSWVPRQQPTDGDGLEVREQATHLN